MSFAAWFLTFFLLLPQAAVASPIDSVNLPLPLIIPFAGALCSIAIAPLIMPRLWHQNYGKMMAVWALFTLILLRYFTSTYITQFIIFETLLHHFFPFIIMIATLYVVTGGITLEISGSSTPTFNVIYLLAASIMASLIGTTGAAILLIRPFLRINQQRNQKKHLVIFFIFLVCNIGGCLTVVGDPPLFLGYLNGINFIWPLKNMFLPFCTTTGLLLAAFYILDQRYVHKELYSPNNVKICFDIQKKGYFNFLLLLCVLFIIILSGFNYISGEIIIMNIPIEFKSLLRDGAMITLMLISWIITPLSNRQQNNFTWSPLLEIIKIFAVIFMTAAPVLLMLKAGTSGNFAKLIHLINDNKTIESSLYFWLSGILSAFLDNAPTYLIFFNMAGGQASILMTSLNKLLLAFSMGSVFMGALTYIGNAPNFIVKAIAEEHKIVMPGFIGYMGWSLCFLIPIFVVLNIIFL